MLSVTVTLQETDTFSGVASLITKRHRALRTLVNGLYPVLVERLKRHINSEEAEDKPVRCSQRLCG